MSFVLFALTAAMLFYVVRFRIHITISVQSHCDGPSTLQQSTARVTRVARAAKGHAPRMNTNGAKLENRFLGGTEAKNSPLVRDLKSALVNLQVKPVRAQLAAERAAAHKEANFEQQLRYAIRYAQEAA